MKLWVITLIGLIVIAGAGFFFLYNAKENIISFPDTQENPAPVFLPQGEPVVIGFENLYLYQYNLLTPECDMHWLRMRIYYECVMLPDAVTVASPYVYIYFKDKLDVSKETCLNTLMSNKNVCEEPTGITCKIYADITPQALESKTLNEVGYKPMYYSNGTRVWIILFDTPSVGETNDLKDMLMNMWTINCSK